jgi:hypothetical protein
LKDEYRCGNNQADNNTHEIGGEPASDRANDAAD